MNARRAVLERPAPSVARELLGWTLTHRSSAGEVTVRIVETEAYEGGDDPASHAFRGPTQRTAVMFGPAGFLYVYRSYGLHWAMNVVTGPEGRASAVLLRAGEVVTGLELARSRRGGVADDQVARGPGNLAQALGVVGEHGGADLLRSPVLFLRPGLPPGEVATGPRVGVTLAHDIPWRFWAVGSRAVSAYRRSPRAR